MPRLVQYGPRSLNFVNKKAEGRRVVQENLMLKDRIDHAQSSVRKEELAKHQEKVGFVQLICL